MTLLRPIGVFVAATAALAACSTGGRVCCVRAIVPIAATATPSGVPSSTATPSATPAPAISPTALPTATATPSASPRPTASETPSQMPVASPTPTPLVPLFGSLTIGGTNPVEIGSVPGSGTFTIQENGPAGQISLSISCTGGAAATITPTSAPIGSAATTITINATATTTATPPPAHACTVSAMSTDLQSATVQVDIQSASGTVMARPKR